MPVDPSMLAKALMGNVPRTSGAPMPFDLASVMKSTLPGYGVNPSSPEAKALRDQVRKESIDIAMSLGPQAIAFHGSPHLFDKFDMSKIGTGEGAQAYGHGLYFAENPLVANGYKTGGGAFQPAQQVENVMVGNKWAKQFPKNSPESQAAIAFSNDLFGISIPEKIGKLRSAGLNRAAEFLEQNSNKFKFSQGSLYKVDLPDEAIGKMLDWDKPLSQQSSAVRKALEQGTGDLGEAFNREMISSRRASIEIWKRRLQNETDPSMLRNYAGNIREAEQQISELTKKAQEMTGRDVYEQLTKELGGGHEAVSKYINSLGIPGIKYLDQGSRTAGKGTYNYVVFDENLPKIVGKE